MNLLDWILVLACILVGGFTILRSRSEKPSSDSTQCSGPSAIKSHARELNDSLYELYKPPDTPSMYIIFFHGLQSGDSRDPHLSTWKSGDGSRIWPQTWLIEEFPGAHVFTVSYTANVRKDRQGSFDMYNIVENLLSDILQENIGQAPYCPVILVGHCFGGLVIKKLCCQAYETFNLASDQKNVKLAKFLANIRGIFYYGTPHHGSPLMDKSVDDLGSNLLKYFKILSTQGARLNSKFEKLRSLNPKWRIHGLGESLPTKSGLFQGVVGAPEASSRAGDSFHVVEADHSQICRPMTTTNRSFYGLTELLKSISEDVKEEKVQAIEKSRLQNLLYLPTQLIGIDVPIQEVKTKLVQSITLGLVGMGGRGKTTLAKATFNNLAVGFEYTSFVSEVKLISGREDDVKDKVWSHMHHFGEAMARDPKWSLLKEKRLLLVLDDVFTDRDLDVLFDIAKDSSPESRFIVTSRDRELLKGLDDLYEVPFLNDGVAKELFMRYAFPGQDAPPYELASLVNATVVKCDGLPLTLEVLGKYLHKRNKKEDWEQTLDALDKAEAVTGLNERLWDKLKLSFNGLQVTEQQVFLDVATFFYRKFKLGEALIAWKAAYAPANERLLWRSLVDRSLVYDVQENEEIKLHEQLLSLGRKIGAEHDKRRRVWDTKEAVKLLQPSKQPYYEECFAVRIDEKEPRIARSVFLSLKEVRYLDVAAEAIMEGATEDGLVPALTNLVFLIVHGPWKFNSRNDLMQLLFDSTLLTGLVILELRGSRDEHLPESLSHLWALKVLKLKSCSLKSLPENIGHLQQLQSVYMDSCRRLDGLPDSFGDLSALNHLELCQMNLRSLPKSFGHLSALSDLRFRNCSKLHTLPESFGQLSALQHLQLHSCGSLCALPSSFGQLTKLEDLRISLCLKLDILPDSFEKLISLRHLRIEAIGLRTTPDSIRGLPSLQVLELGFLPFVKELPTWLGAAQSGLRKTSIKIFHVQEGNFALAAERNQDAENVTLTMLVINLHTLALERVRTSNLVRRCDECGMYPLEWPRYKSSTEVDYALCYNCFQKSGGDASEYTCVDRPVFHPRIICDDCEMNPLEGPRYKSSTRFDFDLCQNCFQRRESNPSEYIRIDPPVLSAGDGTTDFLDAILAIYDDLHSAARTKLPSQGVFLQERGILKRLTGNLLGALEDLNHALEIARSETFSDFEVGRTNVYRCLKHRAYVKYLLGDLDEARRDAHEALSIRSEKGVNSVFTRRVGDYLQDDSVNFLDIELIS